MQIIHCYSIEDFIAIIAGLTHANIAFKADSRRYTIEITGY
jgi:hypothetical protein